MTRKIKVLIYPGVLFLIYLLGYLSCVGTNFVSWVGTGFQVPFTFLTSVQVGVFLSSRGMVTIINPQFIVVYCMVCLLKLKTT